MLSRLNNLQFLVLFFTERQPDLGYYSIKKKSPYESKSLGLRAFQSLYWVCLYLWVFRVYILRIILEIRRIPTPLIPSPTPSVPESYIFYLPLTWFTLPQGCVENFTNQMWLKEEYMQKWDPREFISLIKMSCRFTLRNNYNLGSKQVYYYILRSMQILRSKAY